MAMYNSGLIDNEMRKQKFSEENNAAVAKNRFDRIKFYSLRKRLMK
jgi:hypothetical protein